MLNDNQLIAKVAQAGAKKGNCGKLCKSCAFRLNSLANQKKETVEVVRTIIDELAYNQNPNVVFNCHDPETYEKIDKVCVGFLYAKQFFNL